MVLIHFHLQNPILIGKKKTQDVQFLTEVAIWRPGQWPRWSEQVVDASVALDGVRRSMYDPDELDEEQRERHLRKKLNEMSPCSVWECILSPYLRYVNSSRFKEFCKKVERIAKHHHHQLESGLCLNAIPFETPFSIRFDIPYRDLGFHGVPNREMVLIQPTVHCLVNITDTPFFVVELNHVFFRVDMDTQAPPWHKQCRWSMFTLSVALFDQRTLTWWSSLKTSKLHRYQSMPCRCTNSTQFRNGSRTALSHIPPIAAKFTRLSFVLGRYAVA